MQHAEQTRQNTFHMDIRAAFARNLRRARYATGLSQEALAHEADVDRTYISSLEHGGGCAATINMVVGKLAEVLGVEPDARESRLDFCAKADYDYCSHI